jgi:hypothetical protein
MAMRLSALVSKVEADKSGEVERALLSYRVGPDLLARRDLIEAILREAHPCLKSRVPR